MSVRQRHTGLVHATAIPWRMLAHRFSFILFIAMALGLLVLSRSKPVMMQNIRTHMVDSLAPALDAAARPLGLIEDGMQRVNSYFRLQKENAELRAANAQMVAWQNAALALENENKELRTLLHYKAEPRLSYISARVIADTGGPFVRTLVVTAGKVDGVREGMAAMTGEGLIGRVVEVGSWSSRILLITDLSSRIPVTVTGTGEHAILAGDNSAQPKLLYLPQDAVLTTGSRILTSGHGGVFPPDLPVGVVSGTANGAYEIVPLAALGRVNHVRLIDFNLAGGTFNPIATKIEAQAKTK